MGRRRIHKLIDCTCPCGNVFQENEKRLSEGCGKYCSRPCMYKYRTRPSGLKYNIVKENPTWFKKGNRTWSTGKSLPESTKQKISQTSKGQRRSPNTEFKKGQTAGNKNINWKGGITPLNQKIRHSTEYKEWRIKVFERDNYTCIWCKRRGGKLNAEHIKPFAKFPELRFDLDNGRTLCVECHRKTPTYGWRLLHDK